MGVLTMIRKWWRRLFGGAEAKLEPVQPPVECRRKTKPWRSARRRKRGIRIDADLPTFAQIRDLGR